MWGKLSIGAWSGLVLGHFMQPGHASWLVIGVVAAYCVELSVARNRKTRHATYKAYHSWHDPHGD